MKVDQNLYYSRFGENKSFAKLAPKATRIIENATTGVDGFNKLRDAYPINEVDADCVQNCVCEVIYLLTQIEEAEEAASIRNGMASRGDGTYTPKMVSSMSSGNESISFNTGANNGASTIIEAAAASLVERNRLIRATIRDYLSGVKDANGVNLLYRGEYPYVC